MRPLRLEMEGFGSFRRPTVIDFDGCDLFVLTGPTGAGKSTVLDAIVFALYGQVPRYDDKGALAPAVSQGLLQARVRLDFSLGNATYTVARVVRLNRGRAAQAEVRLEHDGRVLASGGGVTKAVEGLIGLTSDHFCQCVVLPQGAFAEFLHAKPADRQKLLVELLGLSVYGRVAGLARQRAVQVQARAQAAAHRLDALGDATPVALERAEARLEALETLRQPFEADLQHLKALEEQGAGLARRDAEAARLEAALAAVRAPASLAELGTALEDARRAVTAAEAQRDAAVAAGEAAPAALEALPDPAQLKATIDKFGRLAALQASIDRGGPALEALRRGQVAAETGCAGAQTALEAAVARRDQLQRSESAYHAAEGLQAGDTCPVCGETLHRAPEVAPPAGLDHAETAVKSHQTAARTAERALQAARDAVLQAEPLLARDQTERDVLAFALAQGPSEAEARAQVAAAEQVQQARDRAGRDLREAVRQQAAAAQKLQELDALRQQADQALQRTRLALAALAPPETPDGDIAGAWAALVTWAAAQRTVQAAQRAAIAEEAQQIAAVRSRALEAQWQRCIEAGVGRTGDSPRDAWLQEITRAGQRIEQVRERQAEAAELARAIAQDRHQAAVAEELRKHLTAAGFEAWYLELVLEQLLNSASVFLRELSSGQYSLTAKEREILVTDHGNADETRLVKTLSGGETFLASLSLALALAQQVSDLAAGGVARLDSMFLDEGFGTLDPRTLDDVSGAIQQLAARGRMVGIVTHVRELAEQLPVRFEVRRDAHGSHIERVVG